MLLYTHYIYLYKQMMGKQGIYLDDIAGVLRVRIFKNGGGGRLMVLMKRDILCFLTRYSN